MDYWMIGIIGLIIGSFLNVCIYRIPLEQSIIVPSSHCTRCNHKLSVMDLIPILSYIFLRGRCRYCKQKISIQYPVIEILNAVSYLALYYKFGCTFVFIKYTVFISTLIVIAMIDGKTKFVYKSTTIFAILVGSISLIIDGLYFNNNILSNVIGAAEGFIVITIIVFATKGMGEGDVEIALICGLFLGFKLLSVGLFISFIVGGITAAFFLIKRKKAYNDEMAFGPSLAVGAVVSLFLGKDILSWYLLYL